MDDFFENIGMEEVFIFIMVLFGLLLVFGAFAAYAKRSQDKANNAQPVLRQAATVVDKQPVPNSFVSVSDAWVVFQVESGARVRLYAKNGELYVVGDKGILTWQGTRLDNFQLLPRQDVGVPASPFSTSATPQAERVFCTKCGQAGTSAQNVCPYCGTPRKQ